MSFTDMDVFRPTEAGLDVVESGAVDHLLRTESSFDPATASLAGTWRSDEIAMTATIAPGDPAPFSLTSAFGTTSGVLGQRGAGLWLVIDPKEGGGATLERDGDHLLLSTPRSRRLRFTRAHCAGPR